jgi:hypothetical protein
VRNASTIEDVVEAMSEL